MKVLFITPYPPQRAPSQRFRFEQYVNLLRKNNISPVFQPFINEKGWRNLYLKGQFMSKVFAVIRGYLKRAILLFSVPKYELVFLHREAAPFGPPIFEWIISKIFRKKIIYDFDDAIWLSDKHKGFSKWIKNPAKVNQIIRWSGKVSCGNEFLCNHARKLNASVFLIPTTIDTNAHHNQLKKTNSGKVTIGWTGTHSTMKYLDLIVPVLKELYLKHPFTFVMICNEKPSFSLPELEFIPWNKESEIQDLLKMDIGVMPLEDDEWSQGKCGFKALQYMALGIPAIASPVGVNKDIITDGVNGYLCTSETEWLTSLSHLLQNQALRSEMSIKAREKIIKDYSVEANTEKFLNLFLK